MIKSASQRAGRRVRTGERTIWWTNPGFLVLYMVTPTLWMAWRTSDGTFRREWNVQKYLTTTYSARIFALAVMFALPAIMYRFSSRRRPRLTGGVEAALDDRDRTTMMGFAHVAFRLSLLGYGAWAVAAVVRGLRPADLAGFLAGTRGASSELKRGYFATIPGLTTLSTLGLAAVILAALARSHDPRLARRIVGVSVALAFARAFLRSERLAAIEVVAALMIVYLLRRSSRSSPGSIRRWRLAPIVLVPALVLGFAFLEYFKSWTYYSTVDDRGLYGFATARLVGYYGTAYNNAALRDIAERESIPSLSLAALWDLPGVEQARVFEMLNGGPADYQTILDTYGNPEFNNPSGIGVLLDEYGLVVGVVLAFALGSLAARSFRAFWITGSRGALVYPLVFVAALEAPRTFYLGESRVTAPLLLLVWVDRQRSARRSRGNAAAPVIVSATQPDRDEPVNYGQMPK